MDIDKPEKKKPAYIHRYAGRIRTPEMVRPKHQGGKLMKTDELLIELKAIKKSLIDYEREPSIVDSETLHREMLRLVGTLIKASLPLDKEGSL